MLGRIRSVLGIEIKEKKEDSIKMYKADSEELVLEFPSQEARDGFLKQLGQETIPKEFRIGKSYERNKEGTTPVTYPENPTCLYFPTYKAKSTEIAVSLVSKTTRGKFIKLLEFQETRKQDTHPDQMFQVYAGLFGAYTGKGGAKTQTQDGTLYFDPRLPIFNQSGAIIEIKGTGPYQSSWNLSKTFAPVREVILQRILENIAEPNPNFKKEMQVFIKERAETAKHKTTVFHVLATSATPEAYIDAMAHLISCGLDPQQKDAYGYTPSDLAKLIHGPDFSGFDDALAKATTQKAKKEEYEEGALVDVKSIRKTADEPTRTEKIAFGVYERVMKEFREEKNLSRRAEIINREIPEMSLLVAIAYSYSKIVSTQGKNDAKEAITILLQNTEPGELAHAKKINEKFALVVDEIEREKTSAVAVSTLPKTQQH